MSMGRFFKILIVSLISTALALAVAELVLRKKFEITPDFYRGLNSAFGRQIRKESNSLGFRDYEHSREKPAGRKRIVVLGDSITAGWGVEFNQTYPRVLESMLKKEGDFEVIVLAKPGWNTVQELAAFEEIGLSYRPDMVIVGFCLNDPERARRDRVTRRLRRLSLYREPEGIMKPLVEHFMFFRLIYKIKEDFRVKKAFVDYINYLYSDEYQGWKHTVEAFRKLKELSLRHHFRLLVVIFPFLNYSLKSYPFMKAHVKLHKLLSGFSIPYIDLLPLLKKYSNLSLMAEPGRDPHPNATVHRIAAEQIYNYIEKEGLLR